MVAETPRGRDGVARTALGACRHQAWHLPCSRNSLLRNSLIVSWMSHFCFFFFFNKTIDLLVVICLKYTIVLVNPFWPVFIFHYVRSSETPQADEQV